MDMHDFHGKRMAFYGVDSNCFRVAFEGEDPRTFEVIEDENDGYRSSMNRLDEIGDRPGLVFYGRPVTEVVGKSFHGRRDYTGANDLMQFIDDAGHIWLEFGTTNTCDYYPCFEFHYQLPPVAP